MSDDTSANVSTRRQTLRLFGSAAIASAAGSLPSTAATSPDAAPDRRIKITQVRNATVVIEYGGVRFLVDPMLADQGAYPGFAGSVNSERRNPLVPLPMPIEKIADVDALIVTHLHTDHWDEAAKARLKKSMPIFAQNSDDAAQISNAGFTDVRVLTDGSQFRGVELIKTPGRHGTEAALQAAPRLGHVCGVALKKPSLRTIYVAGDTIWNSDVAETIRKHQPDVILLNAGKATIVGLDPIIMGEEDVLAVHKAAPNAQLVATHMEAVNHCVLSRDALRSFATKAGFAERLAIPADGETILV